MEPIISESLNKGAPDLCKDGTIRIQNTVHNRGRKLAKSIMVWAWKQYYIEGVPLYKIPGLIFDKFKIKCCVNTVKRAIIPGFRQKHSQDNKKWNKEHPEYKYIRPSELPELVGLEEYKEAILKADANAKLALAQIGVIDEK